MKRLLLLLSLFLTLNVSGQILSGVVASKPASAGSSFCAEYQDVYDAMDVLGNVPSAINAGYQNTLVSDLVDAGYWTRMEFFYVFATQYNEAGQALINWHNPGTFDADNVSSTAWTSLEGYTGDASADYISTNYNPYSDAINVTNNSMSMAFYGRVDNDGTGNKNEMSSFDGTYYTAIGSGRSGSAFARINQGTTTTTYALADSRGFFMGSRRGNAEIELYINGTSVVATTNSSASIKDYEIYILARNNANTADYFSDQQISIAFIMDAVSDVEAAAINTIIETYMDAIGKGVQ